MDYTQHYDSPLGGILLASDGHALTGLWFDGQKYYANTLAAVHAEITLPVFEETKRWLELYFQRKKPS
ncbi:MAG: 6-O-methylguanine DNA methyltransferase, partial [Clostridia bacterium]|nr:6-O-methylguanine DNA methyltransferase [Clostridia bacterium]